MLRIMRSKTRWFALFLSVLLVATSMPLTTIVVQAEDEIFVKQFDFGTDDSELADGFEKISDQTAYSEENGYGFVDPSKVTAINRAGADTLQTDFVTYTETSFQVDLPNGDYAVTVLLGDEDDATEVGVVADSIQKVQDASLNAGEITERTFDIALIDGQLTIELTGSNPKISALMISELQTRTKAENPTIYVASDSTAQTYDPYWKPQAGWGQMLDRFLSTDVTVDNQAIGGRSSKTFVTEGRLDTILRDIQPEDYLLIQFGHNDSTSSRPERYVTVEQYKDYLETYVTGVRQRGGIPVLVTPVGRRDFNASNGQFNVSFPEYIKGMEEVAEDLDVLLVDLSALSRAYYNEIGPEGTRSVFLHADAGVYSAFPDGVQDDTHFQEYGAIQIAKLLSSGIKELDTKLASLVADVTLPEAVPAQPTNLQVSGVSNAGAILSWDDVDETDIYRVYQKKLEDTDFELVSTSTVSKVNLNGMEEGNLYQVFVTAVNAKGESEHSETRDILTKEATFKFDFGPEGQTVAEGYTGVDPTTVYNKDSGYGLVSNDGVIVRDRGGDDLLRDWIGYFSVGWDFNVDVPNGLYAVKVHVGDFLGSARTELTIENQGYGGISAPRQGSTEKVIPEVAITDGQMNLNFAGSTGIANGLELTPILVAPSGLALDDQSFESDNAYATISWDAAGGATSYNVYRKVAGTSTTELLDATTEPTFTDNSVVLGIEYEYTVTTIDNVGTETVPSLPLTVSMIDSNQEVPVAPENLKLDSVNKNDLTISWDTVENVSSYNIYRADAEDGEDVLVGQATTNSFTDETVLTTIPYYYRVAAVNAGGVSEKSDRLKTPADTVLLKQMEDIDRAPIALKTDEGVLLSWRLLGTDPEAIGFNIYRDGELLTEDPIQSTTNFVDENGTADSSYQIHPIVNGEIFGERVETTVLENNHFDIPLNKPDDGVTPLGDPYTYRANDTSVGDLDGDGEYELIVKWDPSNAQDNSKAGYTGNVYIDAYEFDGTQLWRVDLGVNIRAGAHYTQFMVYDFDGNGKAEVAFKTSDGTIDGEGNVIGKADADYRYTNGYILQGAEYLSIFNGETGAAMDTIDYEPARGDVSAWGDSYGNRVDRFLAGIAYLDGETPSLVMARGYYTRSVLVAYNFSDGKLEKQWTFDTKDEGYSDYAGQGYHSLSVADVDNDQKDEIIYGQVTIDDDGTGLYNSDLGHGDALHVGEFDPSNDGLEIFSTQEDTSKPYGYDMRDAETGEILWGIETGQDTGRGLTADIDPRYEGSEAWAVDGAWNSTVGGLHKANGEKISDSIPASNFAIWWDGDVLREILDHKWNEDAGVGVGTIDKWDYQNSESVNLLTADGTFSNNHTKGTPALQADLFGDWREEVIWRTEDSSVLRVYFTPEETDTRIHTLMHDAQYRVAVAWQNVGYNQPPHPSFFIGEGMAEPTRPNIAVVDVAHSDTVAPVTSYQIDQEQTNDWYNKPVTIDFNAEDQESGTNKTFYTVNTGEPQEGTSVTLEEDGAHTIAYWSEDNAGNVEEQKSFSIAIDRTAPTIEFSESTDTIFTVDQEITIAVVVEDALSGGATSDFEKIIIPAYQLGLGTHDFEATAHDLAENSATQSLSIKVEVDFDSLANLTKQFVDENGGEQQLVEYLQTTLANAKNANESDDQDELDLQLTAYINAVKATSTDALTDEQANVLISLAKTLTDSDITLDSGSGGSDDEDNEDEQDSVVEKEEEEKDSAKEDDKGTDTNSKDSDNLADSKDTSSKGQGNLPDTATTMFNFLLIGLVLLLAASGVWLYTRKRAVKK
ncbi:OmpL47-type beta-barrel domain-containing protein [Paraliobacillus sediminis]|uniref:rhamnogalacturonan lyase family protein n=1 Tax=Paraliobacillus sediminis TaxID=1885916 RepID=UPI000E3E096F|nr:fibronectin type III domain-containing protein [Paraliobacillus sediminis]